MRIEQFYAKLLNLNKILSNTSGHEYAIHDKSNLSSEKETNEKSKPKLKTCKDDNWKNKSSDMNQRSDTNGFENTKADVDNVLVNIKFANGKMKVIGAETSLENDWDKVENV